MISTGSPSPQSYLRRQLPPPVPTAHWSISRSRTRAVALTVPCFDPDHNFRIASNVFDPCGGFSCFRKEIETVVVDHKPNFNFAWQTGLMSYCRQVRVLFYPVKLNTQRCHGLPFQFPTIAFCECLWWPAHRHLAVGCACASRRPCRLPVGDQPRCWRCASRSPSCCLRSAAPGG